MEHVPLSKIPTVSGFWSGHNPPRTKGFLYGTALAVLVYSITPIAYLILFHRIYKTGSLISIPYGFWAKFWYIYSLFEIPFHIYLRILTRRASKRPPPLDVSIEKLHTLLTKSLSSGLQTKSERANGRRSKNADDKPLSGLAAMQNNHIDETDAEQRRERLRSWFFFAPIEDIYEDNVREWLAWAFAARNLDEALADERYGHLINDGLEMVKLRLNWPDMRKGHNPKVKTIRLTLDPVRTMNRPFGYYVVTNGVSFAAIGWLIAVKGFRWETVGKCSFLVKPAAPRRSPKEKTSLPIVFCHGLGIGMGQYVATMGHLARHRDGVIILLQPHISTNIFSKYYLEPPSKDEQAEATIKVMRKHNMSRVTTLSHSNGTMVLGWLLRTAPEMFVRNILVDPVSFCMWEGSVCYSFVHRRWASGVESLLGYFVGRELGVAHTIARRFLWFDMILWAEEFPSTKPADLHFIFAERDVLVDVPGSVRYLREAGIDEDCITVMRNYNHGQALIVNNKGMQLAFKHAGLRV
jgi:hypothetical protein